MQLTATCEVAVVRRRSDRLNLPVTATEAAGPLPLMHVVPAPQDCAAALNEPNKVAHSSRTSYGSILIYTLDYR
ncbi:hypothetical protein [Lysobacter sp. GCM10012299]|uniref:hypothetical protein n=1 Tax=Lysobacter sp. GCM10012299 TaxID=3317333 RepID=UPI00361C2770